MNNEETIIMQPQTNNDKAQQTKTSTESPKEEKSTNSGVKVGATIAAATIGSFAGGAGTIAAANMMNTEEADVQDVENVQDTEAKPSAKPVEQSPAVETKEEEIPVAVDENGEADYTGHAGADPVAEDPQPTPVSNDSESGEVQVLGVYENEDGQEAVVLTDGETVAAVLDANGDGEANVIGIDENMNGQFEEGEVYDISDQHISMSQYEDAYLAQQQEQMQQETFAINADDQQDYNNDAPDLSFA